MNLSPKPARCVSLASQIRETLSPESEMGLSELVRVRRHSAIEPNECSGYESVVGAIPCSDSIGSRGSTRAERCSEGPAVCEHQVENRTDRRALARL